MKSKTVLELMSWLEKSVRIIDQPRNFSSTEVEKLTEIAEIELSGNNELLEKKIIEFKNVYGYCKPIR